MRSPKGVILFCFLLLPAWAFAHGEEVLVPFFILVISVIHFLIFILLIKLPYTTKALLATVYVVAIFAVIVATNNLPFQENMVLINLLIGGTPVLSVILAYVLFQLKNKGSRI
jgi:hypothetical protein